MGNQQERLVSQEFIAGLLVGEGHFGLGVTVRRGKQFQVTPMMHVVMNDLESMQIVSDSLHALGFAHYVLNVARRQENWTDGLAIRVMGHKRLKKFLEVFLPLLTGKKQEAAQIVSDFIASRETSLNPNSPYSEHEVDLIERLRAVNGATKGVPHALAELRKLNALPKRIH